MLSPLLARLASNSSTSNVAIVEVRPDGALGSSFTYAQIHKQAERIARTLLSDGRSSLNGERVAIFLSSGVHFVEAFFGILLAGGCVIVLTALHPPSERSYFCEDAHVRVIIDSAWIEAMPAHSITSDTNLPNVLASDAAIQLYTSGTTGKPKGAVLTHSNLSIQQSLVGTAWGFSPNDTLLHVLPLHHMHGLAIALLTALGAGACVHMLPSFDAAHVWECMQRATVFMAVPTIYTKLFGAFDNASNETRERWSDYARKLRLATSGSAALPVGLGERWRALTGFYPLERFGMTEIGVGTTNPLNEERRPGTVGMPLPSVELRIADESGVDSTTGELLVRGPSVFAGYFNRPEATEAAFVSDPNGGEKWFRTGDTVARDADGYVRILGRSSVDILKSGGYKLSALEIEEVLREHPSIAEVAVVGVPDETWGDRVVACVVARVGFESECTEEAIRAFARERIAPYKVPKNVVRLAELPRNTMGKVVKPDLVRSLKL